VVPTAVGKIRPGHSEKLFESDIRTLGPAEIPKFKQLADFIEGQCRVLDSLGKPREPASTTNSSRQVNTTSTAKSVFIVDSSPQNCALCTGEHVIYKCPEFTPKTSRKRFEIIKSRRLCINCLRPAHNVRPLSVRHRRRYRYNIICFLLNEVKEFINLVFQK
jgi:hypothetical protein